MIGEYQLNYFSYQTSSGMGAVVLSKKGVKKHFWPVFSPKDLQKELLSFFPQAELKLKEDINPLLKENLVNYFQGRRVEFKFIPDLSCSSFAFEVYQKVKEIPFAETRSYLWVADSIGKLKSYRAVGNVLRVNPLPVLIPCHRVVSCSGIGGWTGPTGWKEKLINLERKAKERVHS